MRARIAAFIVALAGTTAWAQWIDPAGKALPDTASRKTADGMGAMLVLTSNYNDFIKEWTGSDEKHTPQLKPVAELKRGDDATILVFFSGCAKPGERCVLTADFKVIAPNGSVYGEFKDRPAFDDAIDKAGTVMLSHAMTQMRIEPNDALGEYKVLVTMHRPSTKTSIELEQSVRVIQ
ncbi:MAG TPA: hypothetical protein VKR38_06315 [Usitatibacter sp.]|nr:hypothetical protein [Usitatibacter sp.]